jgi:hypothetical protein
MSNESRDFQFFRGLYSGNGSSERVIFYYFHTDLNIKGGIESHRQVALIIFIEHAKETLFEDGRRKRV